jgi:hypothetical protein
MVRSHQKQKSRSSLRSRGRVRKSRRSAARSRVPGRPSKRRSSKGLQSKGRQSKGRRSRRQFRGGARQLRDPLNITHLNPIYWDTIDHKYYDSEEDGGNELSENAFNLFIETNNENLQKAEEFLRKVNYGSFNRRNDRTFTQKLSSMLSHFGSAAIDGGQLVFTPFKWLGPKQKAIFDKLYQMFKRTGAGAIQKKERDTRGEGQRAGQGGAGGGGGGRGRGAGGGRGAVAEQERWRSRRGEGVQGEREGQKGN